LKEEAIESSLDRAPRHFQLLGDLGVVAALQEQFCNLLIAFSQSKSVLHELPLKCCSTRIQALIGWYDHPTKMACTAIVTSDHYSQASQHSLNNVYLDKIYGGVHFALRYHKLGFGFCDVRSIHGANPMKFHRCSYRGGLRPGEHSEVRPWP
jgi:hypothetical protein